MNKEKFLYKKFINLQIHMGYNILKFQQKIIITLMKVLNKSQNY